VANHKAKDILRRYFSFKQTDNGSVSKSAVWLIFLVGLIVRVIHIALLKEGFYFSDFKAYDDAAQSLIAGQGFGAEFARPPLYPLFLAGNYLLFGIHILPVRIVQAFVGALGCVLIFNTTNHILGRKAAFVAAAISVFYPYYIFIAGLLYPTLLTSFLLICVIYLIILALKKNSVLWLVIASLCLGLASLAVPVSLAFLPFLILWFFLFSGFESKRKVSYSIISLSVVVICLSPWIYRCYDLYGKFVLIDPRVSKHLPVVSQETELGKGEKVPSEQRIGLILSHPGKFLLNVSGEFIRFWKFVPDRVVTKNKDYRIERNQMDERMVVDNPYTSHWVDWVSILTYGPVFILAIIGVVLGLHSWRFLSLPVFLLLSHAIGYSFFFSQTRYRLPVEFCLMILAGSGVVGLWTWLRGRKSAI